jgi:hypothetical protein
MTRAPAQLALGVLAVGALALAGVACDDAEEKVNDATARAGAEGFRVSIKAQDTDDDSGGVRSIEALRAAAEDVPGDPDITGIEDSDGDGVDDDGLVEVKVGDQVACVQLPESGDEVDVTGDACN